MAQYSRTVAHTEADAGSGNEILVRLLDDYEPLTPAEVADVERIQQLLDTVDPWSRATPLHVTASALIIDRTTRRVLLRWHERQQSWLQVGGHGDPGETDPLAIALREASEETGLGDLAPWTIPAVPCHVVIVPVPASSKEPAHEHADLRFVLSTDRPFDSRAENESAPIRWLSLEEAKDLTSEDNVHETLRRTQALTMG